jgi:hypothetical protein
MIRASLTIFSLNKTLARYLFAVRRGKPMHPMSVLVKTFGSLLVLFAMCASAGDVPTELRVGRAGHAFDHLGNIGSQAETAAAAGATIIYASGLGGLGYGGLPASDKFAAQKRVVTEYSRHAKQAGIRLLIGYICATSIVGLDTFDKYWTPAFRAQFRTPPSEWRQQDQNGKALPSWYGGEYQPACMNNPDWRTYEKFMIRQQIESGHDGIFFDNPTVHPQGCFCEYCMAAFARWLHRSGASVSDRSLTAMRAAAVERKADFLRFRCSIARDFLADMRRFARSLKRDALITCNNSLNSPDVLFAQCRSYAYNISELSQAEDYVVVEDMGHQPRTLSNGDVLEYGPTYELIHAVSHGKPLVTVTIAEADYHTPPNLVRLAMAEAAAHDASYLGWPTWPEEQRARMITAIRPQADWLRKREDFLNDTAPRRDAILFLPFRRWIDTGECVAGKIAAQFSKENIQYEIVNEDQFALARITSKRGPLPVLVVESRSILNLAEAVVIKQFEAAGGRVIATESDPKWIAQVTAPSLMLTAPTSVRAVVRDQPKRTMIHLLNLNIQRLSSFEDKVEPASEISVRCRVPFSHVRSVRALTAYPGATHGNLQFTVRSEGDAVWVQATIPRLDISTILVIEK